MWMFEGDEYLSSLCLCRVSCHDVYLSQYSVDQIVRVPFTRETSQEFICPTCCILLTHFLTLSVADEFSTIKVDRNARFTLNRTKGRNEKTKRNFRGHEMKN